jgi:hypothetical protein
LLVFLIRVHLRSSAANNVRSFSLKADLTHNGDIAVTFPRTAGNHTVWSTISALPCDDLLPPKHSPITAAVTLALGIGANTGIFTLVSALMMESLPVADPQRIIRLGDGDNCCVTGAIQDRFSIYSYPLYQSLRQHTPEFEEMSAFQAGIGDAGVRRAGANVSQAVHGPVCVGELLHPVRTEAVRRPPDWALGRCSWRPAGCGDQLSRLAAAFQRRCFRDRLRDGHSTALHSPW